MKSALERHPDLKAVVNLGQAREKTALPVGPQDYSLSLNRSSLLGRIVPSSLQVVNVASPTYVRKR